MKKETVQTIDLTPTWQEILPILLDGSQRGIESCNAELMRMAKLADKYIESLKLADKYIESLKLDEL